MIVFEKIRWKNLLSFGETPTEVRLDTGKMVAIRGENSSGKSVFLEAMNFVLFGKPFRKINKPKLVNSRNGRGLLVEIWFHTENSTQYNIRRGMSPAIFEIYRDGQLVDQNAASRDYQQYLERYILGIDYNSFNQIVVLGKASYTSFMRLSLDQRRRFVESILDLNIFGSMLDIHKKNVSQLKSDIQDFKITFTVLREKITLQEKHLDTLKNTNSRRDEEHKKNIQDQIDIIESEIGELEERISSLEKEIPECKWSNVSALMKRVSDLDDLLRRAETKKRGCKKNLEILDLSVCPTCHQNIEDGFKNSAREEFHNTIREIELAEKDISDKRDGVKLQVDEQTEIDRLTGVIRDKIRDISVEISLKKKTINSLSANRENNVSDSEIIKQIAETEASVNDMKIEYENLLAEKGRLLNMLEQYEVVTSLLGDTGIRKTVIRTFIPLINKSVNYFLSRLNFPVRFKLEEDFSEEINARGSVIGYYSCSEGEKEKIDLGLLLAWRDVARIRSRFSCNVLIFDEMFDSSLDLTSIESLVIILRELENTSVFVITHSGAYAAEFDSTILVEKQPNGFSRHYTVEA